MSFHLSLLALQQSSLDRVHVPLPHNEITALTWSITWSSSLQHVNAGLVDGWSISSTGCFRFLVFFLWNSGCVVLCCVVLDSQSLWLSVCETILLFATLLCCCCDCSNLHHGLSHTCIVSCCFLSPGSCSDSTELMHRSSVSEIESGSGDEGSGCWK